MRSNRIYIIYIYIYIYIYHIHAVYGIHYITIYSESMHKNAYGVDGLYRSWIHS